MDHDINSDVFILIEQLRQMQVEAEVLTERQLDLGEQLKNAEEKALNLHHKLVEERCDVGGEA